jgi:adenine phosphoribosyltransferase
LNQEVLFSEEPWQKDLGCGFVPVRKPNKLPAERISESYYLEYGEDKIEIHKDAIQKGDRVLMHDDLLGNRWNYGGCLQVNRKARRGSGSNQFYY